MLLSLFALFLDGREGLIISILLLLLLVMIIVSVVLLVNLFLLFHLQVVVVHIQVVLVLEKPSNLQQVLMLFHIIIFIIIRILQPSSL